MGPALTQLAVAVHPPGPRVGQLAVAVRVGRPGPGQLTQLTMPVVQGLDACSADVDRAWRCYWRLSGLSLFFTAITIPK